MILIYAAFSLTIQNLIITWELDTICSLVYIVHIYSDLKDLKMIEQRNCSTEKNLVEE